MSTEVECDNRIITMINDLSWGGLISLLYEHDQDLTGEEDRDELRSRLQALYEDGTIQAAAIEEQWRFEYGGD